MSTQATDTAATSLGTRIKACTWDLHQQAEHDLLPQHMARGTMPREAYIEMLGQQYLAQRVLDEAIRAHRPGVPALATMIDDQQLQGPHLRADLEHLGVDPGELEARAGTRALIDHVTAVAASSPIRLLGLHYVREGANNGNRFIAMKLRKSWGVPMDQRDGFRYLDPYGAEQRPRWEAFKQKLDTLDLTPAQQDDVVAAARDMFSLVIAMHKDHDLPPLPEDDAHHAAHRHG